MTFRHLWPAPQSRDVGSFGGINLYIEVLQFATRDSVLSIGSLMSESDGLGQRLRGSLLIKEVTKTIAKDVIRELVAYGWIREISRESDKYSITEQGKNVAYTASVDLKAFRRTLAVKMQERFVVPGWMVYRLHQLNPSRQGEVVLPAPPRDKDLPIREWNDKEWTTELSNIAQESANAAMMKYPGSFPVSLNAWISEVERIWVHLGEAERKRVAKPRADAKQITEKPRINTYSTRHRLSLAMREASVNLLFGNREPGINLSDFESSKHPIPARSFQSWCPILDALEFVFYTDHSHEISGRLIFPCGGYRPAGRLGFEEISEIKEPNKKFALQLYQPSWEHVKTEFRRTLQDVYLGVSRRVGSIYVSLLDVRDEVSRRLRLSATLFDAHFEQLFRETTRDSIVDGKPFSISLESDIRPAHQSGSGLLRRPIYIGRVPYTLIGISTGRVTPFQERTFAP